MPVLWFFLGAALLFAAQRGLISRLWDKGLRVRVRFRDPCITDGEDAVLLEQTDNRKLLPLPLVRYHYELCRNFEQLQTADARPLQISCRLALPTMRSVRNQTVLPALRRGVYTVNGLELATQDLFFSRKLRKPQPCLARLTVYPKKLDASSPQLPYRQLLGAVLTRHSTLEDPFELRGIRPYEIYDSMRSINWKATARTGELKVNLHDRTTDEAIFLILDAEHGTLAQRETGISLASTLASLFLARGVNVALCANSRSCLGGQEIRVPTGSGSSHLRVIDESLAQIKLIAEPLLPFADYLAQLRERPRPDALCLVLSAGTSKEIAGAFDALCGAAGGYFLPLGEAPAAGRNFTVLAPFRETEAAS